MIKHSSDKPLTQGWTMDRKINIYGTVGMILAIASWTWNVQDGVIENKRSIVQNKALHDLEIKYLKDDRAKQDQLAAERFTEIKVQLVRIENKVDRHGESAHGGG